MPKESEKRKSSSRWKFQQNKEESVSDFVSRVISTVMSPRDVDAKLLTNLKAIIQSQIQDEVYTDMLMNVLMVVIGNGAAVLRNNKSSRKPESIFADFVSEIFTPRYLMNLQRLIEEVDKNGTT